MTVVCSLLSSNFTSAGETTNSSSSSSTSSLGAGVSTTTTSTTSTSSSSSTSSTTDGTYFVLEMYDSISESLTSKIISHKEPVFNARGLQPNRTYILSIFSQNQWGTSEKVLQTLSTVQMSPLDHKVKDKYNNNSQPSDSGGLVLREETTQGLSSQLSEKKRLNSQSYSPGSGKMEEEKQSDLVQVESRTMLKMEEERSNAIDRDPAVDLPSSGTV